MNSDSSVALSNHFLCYDCFNFLIVASLYNFLLLLKIVFKRFKKIIVGTELQKLQVLAALAEGPRSVSNPMSGCSQPVASAPKDRMPLSRFCEHLHTHGMHARHPYTERKKKREEGSINKNTLIETEIVADYYI